MSEEKESCILTAPVPPIREETDNSFVRLLYDKLVDVIGGDNPNQFFCMTMPGGTLATSDYQYDIRKEKPVRVSANESRLTNKLLDPCHITGADNGRTLANQFLSALDTLTPKLNVNISKAKNVLRKMLSTPYSYHLDSGTLFNGTLQQVFHMLYNDWVQEKRKWAIVQDEERQRLLTQYPGDTVADSQRRQEEYLIWYQTNAESYLAVIEAKLGKILGVFSVNDMKIIEGILDSGAGAELQEARTQVGNARKPDPDGGYVYPVKLEPSDWFTYLDTDYSYVDLLESPEAYAMKYGNLNGKRNSLLRKICGLETKDHSADVQKAVDAAAAARSDFEASVKEAAGSYLCGAELLLQALGGLEKLTQTAAQAICDRENKDRPEDQRITPANLLTAFGEVSEAQAKMVRAAQAMTDAALKEMETKVTSFTEFLKPLYQDLKTLEREIEEVQTKLDLANKRSDVVQTGESPLPAGMSKGYMQLIMDTKASSLSTQTSMTSKASASSYGVNFLFGGYHQESSGSASSFDQFTKSEDTSLQVAMNITKVGIVRNWFNPGVLMLSSDMYNTSGTPISVGMPENKATNENLGKMSKCIFPCFPTAFVVAKDVSIRFSCHASLSSEHKDAFQNHASKGGGFLCFHGSSSSSDSGEHSGTSVNCSGEEITIRFPTPQILGYFLEVTPEDNSKHLYEEGAQDISIADFVSQCKEMLDEMNKETSER